MAAEETGLRRDPTGQEVCEPSGRKSATVLGATRSGDGEEKGQASLPLVLVPFEDVSKEEPVARRKQATMSRRLQALTVVQDVLYAAPGRLGQIKGERREANATGAARSEEEAGEGAQPHVPDWP